MTNGFQTPQKSCLCINLLKQKGVGYALTESY